MKIGVNLTLLRHGDDVCEEMQHFINLLDGLLLETKLSFVYYIHDSFKNLFDEALPRIRVVHTWFESHEIERRYRYGEFDVLFSPAMEPGIECAICPMVIFLGDFQYRERQKIDRTETVNIAALNSDWSSKASQTLCVSTEDIASQAQKAFKISRDRIIITPPVSYSTFNKSVNKEIIPSDLLTKLPEHYLLCPLYALPLKTYMKLIKSLMILRGQVPDIQMLFIVEKNSKHSDIKHAIQMYKLENNVSLFEIVDKQYISELYNHSRGLVFPSYYDGIGVPAVEAIVSNCPVACSNRASLHEIMGEDAIFFDPDDPEDIALKIKKLWQGDEFHQDSASKNRDKSEKYNGSKSIDTLVDALYEAPKIYEDPLRWDKSWLTKDFNKHPLVSIIVPSYQQSGFLRESIDSIIEQDYPNIEIIVIDGGSTDGSKEILESYGSQITWSSESDDGQADAINKGLSRSKGEYIGWLNSDDLYRPDAIRTAIMALQGQSGCMLVYGEADYIDENGVCIGRYPTDAFSISNLLRRCCICQPSVFFDKRLIEIAGNLDTSYDMALDYELWLRFSKSTPFLYLPATLSASRLYETNKTAKYPYRSIIECIRASRLHYGRPSKLLCIEYTNVVINDLDFVKHKLKLKELFTKIIFSYALFRFMGPYWLSRIKRLFDIRYE